MDIFVSKSSSSKRPMDNENAEICPEPPTKRPLIGMRLDGVNDIAAGLTEVHINPY